MTMTSGLKKVLQKIWTQTNFLVSALVFLILSVIFLILFIPFFTYRRIVILLAKYFRPDLTHILCTGNGWFALENVTLRPKTNVVVSLVLDGQVPLKELQEIFQKRVLEKEGENGRLVYPELKQVWTQFLGYNFWRNEANFDLNGHIRLLPFVSVIMEKDLKEVATSLISKPWKNEFSPWEFLLIQNFKHSHEIQRNSGQEKTKAEKCALILRFHHTMGDGKGWLQLILQDLLKMENPQVPKPSPKAPISWSTLLMLPFQFPYEFLKYRMESVDPPNPWQRPALKKSRQYFSATSSLIPVQDIKALQKKFDVPYGAVLISILSGGFRRVMQEVGQTPPTQMMGVLVLPLPGGHPGDSGGGICVYATGMNLRWPIGTIDPIDRLQFIAEDMKAKKNSLYPIAFYHFMNALGIFPSFIRRIVYNRSKVTVASSLFPGPLNTPEFVGCPVIDSSFYLGLPGQIGAGVTTLIIGGKQRLVTTIDQSFFPSNAQFEKLGIFLDEELDVLRGISAESFHLKTADPKENFV